jgi:HemY protein
LLGRLLARKGDTRGASKVIEAAFARTPHPDLARAYMELRQGDSAAERLARVQSMAKRAPMDPESKMLIATAALGARNFAVARDAMASLVAAGERPTARMCLIMAELEDREHDAQGLVREWLSRGSRAPRDAVWIADGQWSKQWAPVSPVTGKLDAYRWLLPAEQLSGPIEEPPPAYEPPPPLAVEAPSLPEPVPEAAPPATAEILSPEPAPEAPRPSTSPKPVVFPLPSPPDDPGPKREHTDSRLF